MKVSLLTNIPAPYREKVHEIVSENFDGEYEVIYCSEIEPNRQWKFDLGKYKRQFIKVKSLNFNSKTIYLYSNILRLLKVSCPDVLIVSGFSLPYIFAVIWAKINKKKVIAFSDATILSEKKFSFMHKIIRKWVYKNCEAFIGASQKTLKLFESYGATEKELFQSHLCVNNDLFFKQYRTFDKREYDVLLCGQMVKRKMFSFSLDVIDEIKKIKPNIKIKILGDGPQKETILKRLQTSNIEFSYPGFVQQDELAGHYTNAKVFLFPSLKDPWGVVANEACASGTPVISCENVGAAGELVKNALNGYILPINAQIWAKHVLDILNSAELWGELSEAGLETVSEYSYVNAADGLIKAVNSTIESNTF